MRPRYDFLAVTVLGIAASATALLAQELGIDHNAQWSAARSALLAAGLVLLVIGLGLRFRGTPLVRFLWGHRLPMLAALSVLAALLVYVFFASAGTWTRWREVTRYYDDLGTAFRSGRLDLGIVPAPELAAMPNPYDPAARNANAEVKAFVNNVWDLTFHNGKFYLYWGPGPGLVLAIVKLAYAGPIPDQYLTFVFLTGLLAFSALFILHLRRSLYTEVPVSLVVIGVLVAALICPLPWLMNRAAIYEATIASGQFFLVGGLYVAYTALERQHPSYPGLILAGIMWAFAASSRTLILIPAGFLTFMVVVWLATEGGTRKPILRKLPMQLALGLPLLLGVVAVAAYNWARFGSVLETGLRYTLTFHDLNKYLGSTFSLLYAPSSLWMYLLHPYHLLNRFPFLLATRGRSPAILHLDAPALFNAEEITGLLFGAPFVLFSVVAIIRAVRHLPAVWLGRSTAPYDRNRQLLTWLSVCLAGSALLTFAAICLYFNLTMRFLAEFMPSLVLLSVLGTWHGYRALQQRPVWRTVFVMCVVAIGALTVIVSLLLASSEIHGSLQNANPQLWEQLIRFFGTW